MATTFPFPIPEHVRAKLPRASADGKIYADVKFRGGWDGILVINSENQCIGIYYGRKIVEWSLPFTPDEIEDFRRPCLWNRLLSLLPQGFDIYGFAVLTIWIACPLLLFLVLAVSRWFVLILIPLAFLSIAFMYSVGGFPLTRLPTAIAGIAIAMAGLIALLGSFG